MCGIVGYTGKQSAQDVLLAGLKHMEYRGYDSAGIALVANDELVTYKKAGKLNNLQQVLANENVPL
ncbi:MAG: glutamine--fructose-6-phosphate aminotransferase, partial [Actinomycetota bacterium]|nr:glutamine--fructose-6-phosphate aminotransferase [Actinomycetota bacterium]